MQSSLKPISTYSMEKEKRKKRIWASNELPVLLPNRTDMSPSRSFSFVPFAVHHNPSNRKKSNYRNRAFLFVDRFIDDRFGDVSSELRVWLYVLSCWGHVRLPIVQTSIMHLYDGSLGKWGQLLFTPKHSEIRNIKNPFLRFLQISLRWWTGTPQIWNGTKRTTATTDDILFVSLHPKKKK